MSTDRLLVRRSGAWRRHAAALVTALAGLLTIAAQTSSEDIHDVAGSAFSLPFGRLLGVAGGLWLLALAWGMFDGKRRAADAAIALLCALGVLRWLRGLGVLDGALDVGAAALLAFSRDAFPRGGSPRAGRLSGSLALAAGAAAYALHVADQLQVRGATDVDRAVSLASPALHHAHHALASSAWWLAPDGALPIALDLLVALGVVSACLCLRALLRPSAAAEGHGEADHRRAAAIVAAHGRDSLDPFALREDKSFHFAAGGFLAYRTLRETAVIAGDPIGPAGSAPTILSDFVRVADARGWSVVVTGASETMAHATAPLGLRALHIGNEAVVDPRSFSLEGRAIRKVRQSVHRLERHGWRVDLVAGGELTPALVAELDEVERRWRAGRRRLHGFAMTLGRLWGAEEDGRSLYVMARDRAGRVRSFVRFAILADGLSLDVMRRFGDEPNGVAEALVVAAIEHARAAGRAQVSLSFAGFAHVMAAEAALSRGQRALRWLLRRAHGRFQLERLVRFNAKFGPAWRPRYLLYQRRAQLPLAALRVLQAEAYVAGPRPRPLRSRWQPALGPATASMAADGPGAGG